MKTAQQSAICNTHKKKNHCDDQINFIVANKGLSFLISDLGCYRAMIHLTHWRTFKKLEFLYIITPVYVITSHQCLRLKQTFLRFCICGPLRATSNTCIQATRPRKRVVEPGLLPMIAGQLVASLSPLPMFLCAMGVDSRQRVANPVLQSQLAATQFHRLGRIPRALRTKEPRPERRTNFTYKMFRLITHRPTPEPCGLQWNIGPPPRGQTQASRVMEFLVSMPPLLGKQT